VVITGQGVIELEPESMHLLSHADLLIIAFNLAAVDWNCSYWTACSEYCE